MAVKIIPVIGVSPNKEGSNKDGLIKDEELNKTFLLESLRHSDYVANPISNQVVAKKKSYKSEALKIYKSVEKDFYINRYGLYSLRGQEDSYIYSNALIGVLAELCSDNKNSTRLLNLIHQVKMDDGSYPLSLNIDVKNPVSEITVAMLEHLRGNKNEAERLLSLKGYNKIDGLYTSVNDKLVTQTFMNSMKGTVDCMLGNKEKGKKILKNISLTIPKTDDGVFYVSNDKKIIMPDAIISVAMLKLLTESFESGENYMKSLEKYPIQSGNTSILYGVALALFSRS